MSIRILVVDDHGVLRAGLVALLNQESGMQAIGSATNAVEAIEMASCISPDVVLMDISLPDMSGIEATQKIKQISPNSQVIMLTVHEDKSLLQKAIQAGASGYVVKRAVGTELINAIQAAIRGDIYIHSAMTRKFLEQQNGEFKARDDEQPLSPRERQVLDLIVQGYTNQQAAEVLHISVRTVEYHRSNIMTKLNLSSRVELVRYAKEHVLS